jgi:serine/threonine-protein kinase HipA
MASVTSAYVFVDMPGIEAPVLAGYLRIDGRKGRFIYGASYLSRPDAFALDPINLPLVDVEQAIEGNDGVPAVLLDAGPDNWGQRLMRILHSRQPENKLEELLATQGGGVGALTFSLSRSGSKPRPQSLAMGVLERMQSSIADLVASGAVEPEMLRILVPGSSMGGARPKSVVCDGDGRLWIAKFERPDDLFNQSKAEAMCYLMMRDCGIVTAKTELTKVAGRSVLLVERFDCTDSGRRHFISAHALTYQTRVKLTDAPFVYSYPRLAALINQIGSDPQSDKEDLYRRMIFNIAVGNTDDHMRNHGFLKNFNDDFYRLAPAYDVVPQLSGHGEQAIGVGEEGRRGTFINALSSAGRFGLSSKQASEVIGRVCDIVSQWLMYADKVDLSAADRAVIAPCMQSCAGVSTCDDDSADDPLTHTQTGQSQELR